MADVKTVGHTPTPWKIYDDADPHHIKVKGQYPDIGGAHVADILFPANAAFIVKAVNNHDALVKALRNCRDRLEMDLDEVKHLRKKHRDFSDMDKGADEADQRTIDEADEALTQAGAA